MRQSIEQSYFTCPVFPRNLEWFKGYTLYTLSRPSIEFNFIWQLQSKIYAYILRFFPVVIEHSPEIKSSQFLYFEHSNFSLPDYKGMKTKNEQKLRWILFMRDNRLFIFVILRLNVSRSRTLTSALMD